MSFVSMVKNMTIVTKDIVANGGYDLLHIEHECLDAIVM